jgi:hypothetical protein
MPPSYIKPYVKRQKNDAADPEAICEAVTRPPMRFVEVKSPDQQSVISSLILCTLEGSLRVRHRSGDARSSTATNVRFSALSQGLLLALIRPAKCRADLSGQLKDQGRVLADGEASGSEFTLTL